LLPAATLDPPDVDIQDEDGNSPLSYATSKGSVAPYPEIVNLLTAYKCRRRRKKRVSRVRIFEEGGNDTIEPRAFRPYCTHCRVSYEVRHDVDYLKSFWV